MKIFLVGATGRTGKWILAELLARNHEVTALVRGGAGRLSSATKLRVVEGDLLESEGLVSALEGHEAIISALNSRAVEAGTEMLIGAAMIAKVPRFLGVAGGGILQLDQDRLRRDRAGYPEVFLRSSEGHLRAWRALERSPLEWTLVCTPDLSDVPATGLAQVRADYMPEGGRSVACGDVAAFLAGELEDPKFARRRVGMNQRE